VRRAPSRNSSSGFGNALDPAFRSLYHVTVTTRKHRPDGDPASAAASMFEQVRRIKSENPEVSRKIDRLEAEIRKKMVEIKGLVARMDPKDRDLVTVLIINGIHRTADEVLIE
jgi:hypothetical protein